MSPKRDTRYAVINSYKSTLTYSQNVLKTWCAVSYNLLGIRAEMSPKQGCAANSTGVTATFIPG